MITDKRFLFLILFAFSLTSHAQRLDTVSVYFDLDVRDAFNTAPLDSLFSALEYQEKARVLGYADYLGSAEYNEQLSDDRAKTVAQYINQKGGKKLQVKSISGKGEIASRGAESADGHAPSRRVDVIVEFEVAVESTQPEVVEVVEVVETEAEPLPDPDIYEVDTSSTENIVLEGLSFIPGRHYPLPQSGPVLERLLETMKRYPDLKIEIQGYICCEYSQFDGIDQDTQEPHLSENRAKFVYEYLIESGIDAERMSYKGYGSSKPKVFPEVTEEDQQANRRVEIKVVK